MVWSTATWTGAPSSIPSTDAPLYERANKERQKDNMRSKTQAPEPSGSGACFLILSAPPQACQPKKIRDKSKSFQGRAERNWKEIGLALRASVLHSFLIPSLPSR